MIKNKTKKVLMALMAVMMVIPSNFIQVNAANEQGPGPIKPLDTIKLGDFKASENWTISGAQRKDSSSGTVFKLTGDSATISKDFTYPTWDYSDLSVKINKISEGMTWNLSVKGSEEGSKDMIIQSDSLNANSQYGESFQYSLEGIAGAEAMSNWNNESLAEKTFKMTFTLKGQVDDEIEMGSLNRIKPNYSIPKALDSNVKGKYGGYNFDGNPSLDVDDLKNDDPGLSTNQTLNEHQWASLPYSRLVINPGWEFDNGKMTPVDRDLDMRFGVYYGINGNSNRTVGGEAKSGFQPSFFNSILNIDNQRIDANTIKSAWYPHKLERSGTVTGKGDISLIDFMVDKNTIGRIIDFNSEASKLNVVVKDSTKSGGGKDGQHNLRSQWDDTNNVVIKTDDLLESTDKIPYQKNLFYQAIKVVALNEDGSYNETLTNSITEPTFVDGVGKYDIPSTVKKVGIAIGYATREEGQEVAVNRALKNTINGNLLSSYKETKTYWDNTLRKVPVPDEWGLTDSNIKDNEIVTKDKHKVLYYSGYVHNLINTLDVTPETGYAYTQQALGKPSRQAAGAKMTPANNCWEGVLQIQNIMYIDPSAAWSGMEGFMAMIDANGYLNGEVLPARIAQTFWMVHTVSPDKERLKQIYPALTRHLKYKISDPRWIYGSTNTKSEIDQEYISSWLNDVVYMIKICKDLGGDYAKEASYWEAEYQKSLANYADWFFSDPLSHEAKGSYPQDKSGPQTLRNGAGLPSANHARGLWTRIFHKDGDVLALKDACADNTDEGPHYAHSTKGGHTILPKPGREPREWLQVILSGLVIKDIPTEQAKQLEQFFIDVNNPALPLAGMDNLKWAPNSFIVYGLINRGFYDEAKNQLDSYLVKSIDVWELCENYKWDQTGPKGTSPTSFGASQIIELTMLKNGAMNDGSGVKAIVNWKDGKNKAKSPDVNLYYEGNFDKTTVSNDLPKEVTQVYNRENFDGDKYTVNKVTSVTWDLDAVNVKKLNEQQSIVIKGKTETHDDITATVYVHVTSAELSNLVNDAKMDISKVTIGDKLGQYSQASVDELNKVIADSEKVMNNADAETSVISKQIQVLDDAIYKFKVGPLNETIEMAEKLSKESSVKRSLKYTPKAIQQLNKAIETSKKSLQKDTSILEVVQATQTLLKATHTFRVSEVSDKIAEAKDLISKVTIGDKKGEYSQKTIDELNEIIKSSEKQIQNSDITDEQIEKLLMTMEKAIEKFKASANGNTPIIDQEPEKPSHDDSKTDDENPKTGDESPIMVLSGLGLMSLIGVGYYVVKRKREE
ncbi:MAG: LPXTG cell wall anchor domain-containing protein [Coprobacillus sp.]